MESINGDVILELVSFLDAISICKILQTSKRFWEFRSKNQIIDRTIPYQQFIKYKQWNKGLLESVRRNNFPQVKYFIQSADDTEEALGLACCLGNRPLVNYLMDFVEPDWDYSALMSARGGHKELVDFFYQKQQHTCKSIISGAASGGHIDIVRQYLPLREKDSKMNWAIAYAAEQGNKEIVDLLLSYSAPVLVDIWKMGLYYACKGGQKEMAEFFWEKVQEQRFDSKRLGTIEEEALKQAAKGANMDIIEWLVKMPHHKSWRLALCGAASSGKLDIVKYFSNRDLRKGRDLDWNAALARAAKRGHLDIMKYLFDNGASVNKAFKKASISDHREVIEWLIENGADDWNAGFMGACDGGNLSLAQFFLEKGANNVNEALVSIAGYTSRRMAEFLLSHGATCLEDALQEAIDLENHRVVELLTERINGPPQQT